MTFDRKPVITAFIAFVLYTHVMMDTIGAVDMHSVTQTAKCVGLAVFTSLPLHRQLHDSADNVTLSLLESLHSLGPADAGLRHHQLNVLGLYITLIHITLVLILLSHACNAFQKLPSCSSLSTTCTACNFYCMIGLLHFNTVSNFDTVLDSQ